MKPSFVIAIDLGTSSTRVHAFSKDGKIAAQIAQDFPVYYPHPGWVEQDGDEILDATLRALRGVLKQVGAENVASIGITNQRETVILWDKKTGRPVHRAIVWQDRRTDDFCRSLAGKARLIKKRTGLVVDPYFSGSKLHWLFAHVKGLKRRAAAGEILFGTPDTWLLWNLTKGRVFATEPSNASRTLLYDIRRLRFDPELCRIFSVPTAVLPEVRDSDAHFGMTHPSVTDAEIPITAILGDQQSSLFGHGAWGPGIIKNTYGTGLFVMTNTGSDILNPKDLISTVAWKTREGVSYALEGSILMGGATLQWLRDNLKILASFDEAESMANAIPDNGGVYFVPALQGLGAPHWNGAATGLITGLTRQTDRRHIVRAALESLAYQTRDVVEAFDRHYGKPFRELRVDGGGTRNSWLMRFQADLLGLPVVKPKNAEVTAFGAAALSGLSSGFWTPSDVRRLIRAHKKFTPRKNAAVREHAWRGWKNALARVKTATPPK